LENRAVYSRGQQTWPAGRKLICNTLPKIQRKIFTGGLATGGRETEGTCGFNIVKITLTNTVTVLN
jgi:hypothetical protein